MQPNHILIFVLLCSLVDASPNVRDFFRLHKYSNNTISTTTLSPSSSLISSHSTQYRFHTHSSNTLNTEFVSYSYIKYDTTIDNNSNIDDNSSSDGYTSSVINYNNGFTSTNMVSPTYTSLFKTISTIFPSGSTTTTRRFTVQTPKITTTTTLAPTVITTTSSSEYSQESSFVSSYDNTQTVDENSNWLSIVILSTTTIGRDISTSTTDVSSNTDQFVINDSSTSFPASSNLRLSSSSTATSVDELLTSSNYLSSIHTSASTSRSIQNQETSTLISSLSTTQLPTTTIILTTSISSSTTSSVILDFQIGRSSQLSTSRTSNSDTSSSLVESSTSHKISLPLATISATTPSVSISTSESSSYEQPTESSSSGLQSFPTSTMSTSSRSIAPTTTSKYFTYITSSVHSSLLSSSSSPSSSSLSTSSATISTSQQSVSTPLIIISSLSVTTSSSRSSSIVSSHPIVSTTTISKVSSISSSEETSKSSSVPTESTSSSLSIISIIPSQPSLTETTTSVSTPIVDSSDLPILQSSASTSSSKKIGSFDPFATYTTTTTISFSGLSLFEYTTVLSTPLTSTITSVDSSSKTFTVFLTSSPSTSFAASSIMSSQQSTSTTSTTSTSVITSTTSATPKFTSDTTTNVVLVSTEIPVGNNISTTVLIGSTKHGSVSTPSSKTIINVTQASASIATGTINPSTTSSSSYSTDNPNWWVPTKIITDSENPTSVTGTNTASQTVNLPEMITSYGSSKEPAEGYTLITIGFKKALNYQFVILNPQSSVQIMSFLPEVLNNPFNNNLTDIFVVRLVPLQDESIPYLVTIAECYFPESLITSLSSMIKNSSSPLYTNKASKGVINTLAQLIDPSIPITGLIRSSSDSSTSSSNDSTTTTTNNNNSASESSSDNSNGSNDQDSDGNSSIDLNFANSGTLDSSDISSMAYSSKNVNGSDSSNKTTKKKITGIVIGVVVGSTIYIVAMGSLVRYIINRYKKQNIIKHSLDETFSISSNESSINDEKYSHHSSTNNDSSNNTFLSEEFSIGINAKRGKNVKLKISKPIASQNSLGF